jgi:DNA mismatch repair protein MutL
MKQNTEIGLFAKPSCKMSRIKILPEVLSNKIAAGEVVERPASVVKELVENAIDAGSTQVTVEIQKGGRTSIRVSDNGTGMDRDDALLSLERYATSKISDERDLFAIASMGFRGEALPSIAAVSDMEIVTKADAAEAGVKIHVRGGQIKDVSEVGAPRGTVVTVNRLFFNTPARRKYLKTDKTEMGHVSDTVTRLALAWPAIHFRFHHDGRPLGNWAPASRLEDRIVAVLDPGLENDLFEVSHEKGGVAVHGFAASPDVSRATSRGQYLYVNRRFVRDQLLHHAVAEGYHGRIMKGTFPVAVLFLTLPLDQVDVNVHPTKSSVRFVSPGLVHDVISEGIKAALDALSRPSWGMPRPFRPVRPPQPYTSISPSGQVRESTPMPVSVPRAVPPSTLPLWEKKDFSSWRVIGQLRNTYILCETDDGLVLVDQHAAHERVVFESLKKAYARARMATQGLLIPEKLDMSHREAGIVEELTPTLRAVGVEIEPFGGTTFVVRSVPEILAGKPIAPLIMELIDKAAEIGVSKGLDHAVEACLAVMACHGAVRAHQKMSEQEMAALLKQLDTLEDPNHCPHGRPTIIRYRTEEIEKAFKRVV